MTATTHSITQRRTWQPAVSCWVLAAAGLLSWIHASASDDVAQAPLFLTPTVSPLVMLTMSNDHQLYFEAYPEYADLTGDGEINQTFSPDIQYYGYFDHTKCYDYSTTNERFEPKSSTSDGYCDDVSGSWSGNFLNWVSMSRMDVVRQILYGGYRSTDTNSLTVLERSYLPSDAHAWARFYNGNDIDRLTPFSDSSINDTVVASSSSEVEIALGNRSFTTSGDNAFTTGTRLQQGDQIEARALENGAVAGRMWGVATNSHGSSGNITIAVSRIEGTGTYSNWELENHSRAGISFCNVTYAPDGESQDITAPPLIRVAEGNYALWNANERFQCLWHEEESGNDRINFNDIGVTTLAANSRNPRRDTVGLGQDNYVARIEVCNSGLLGEEECKQYPDGNYKPIGLIQEYGDNESIYFGLLTGSYMKNKSGGVLRKNVTSSADEIDVSGDGTFLVPDDSVGSIIDTLNRFRIFGYDHEEGHYNDTDDCIWGLSEFEDGECTNWGNPQSEMVLEAVRYFANIPLAQHDNGTLAPTSEFVFDGVDKLSGLGHVAWEPPLNEDNWCAAPANVNFNSSVASYDAEILSGATDLPGIDSVAGNANVTDNPSSVYGWTNRIGEGEGLHGDSWFIGRSGTDNNDLCTSKTLGSLAEARGLCPEAPRLGGSFLAAGLAHYAYTQDLRPDLSPAQYGEQNLTTYAVALAPAVPQINIPRPGESEPSVRLLPACYNTDSNGNCAIVDFKVIEQTRASDRNTGRFLVNWEDSEQGGDYDMDMIGILSYEITSSGITISTQTTADTSDHPMGFGYVLSGTNQDGFHVTSGINEFSFTVGGGNNGCTECELLDPPAVHTYALSSGGLGDLLEPPMYYAAKWGGFDRSLNFPDDPESWDTSGNGMPDNYYFAIDPAHLAADLRAVFADIIETANPSAAVATNSSRLDEGTAIFQAMFDSGNWTGDLLSFDFLTESLSWSAAAELRSINFPHINRTIVTTYDGSAVELNSLTPPAAPAALGYAPDGTEDGLITERIEWLYGRERDDLDFRSRLVDGEYELMGDIVNSDPVFVGKPNYGFDSLPGTEGGDYLQHRVDIQARRNMVYVGANDGMLHGFDAETGEEIMAYMPGELLQPEADDVEFAPLSRLMDPGYDHRYYVDGTATVRDAYIDGEWKTILVGTMGAGGRTVFALAVTDPDDYAGTSPADNVLWEFTDGELGWGVTEPEIVRLPGGDWVTVFGNGYGGVSGESGVFVVSLEDPEDYQFVSSEVGTPADRNAMAPPFITDWTGLDDNAIRRTANLGYVGDLHGNLWRMDFGSNLGDLELEPVFKATYDDDGDLQRQPITTKPIGQPNPDDREQYIVSFGTGSYFLNSDGGNKDVQSLYGLIDDFDGEISNDLLEQLIIWQGEGTFTDPDGQEIVYGELRVTTDHELDDEPGWRLDLHYRGEGGTGSLPPQGERVVARPSLAPGVNRPAVRYTTLIPDTDPCGLGRTGFLMELNITSGARPDRPVFDLDGDGQFTDEDTVPIMIDGQEVDVPISGIGGVTQGEELSTVVDEFGVEQIVQPVDPDGGETEPSPGLLGDGASTGRQAWEQLR